MQTKKRHNKHASNSYKKLKRLLGAAGLVGLGAGARYLHKTKHNGRAKGNRHRRSRFRSRRAGNLRKRLAKTMKYLRRKANINKRRRAKSRVRTRARSPVIGWPEGRLSPTKQNMVRVIKTPFDDPNKGSLVSMSELLKKSSQAELIRQMITQQEKHKRRLEEASRLY